MKLMKIRAYPIPADTPFFLSLIMDDFCVALVPLLPSTKLVLFGFEEDKRMRFLHKRIRRMVAAINTMIKMRMTETATMMKYSNRS